MNSIEASSDPASADPSWLTRIVRPDGIGCAPPPSWAAPCYATFCEQIRHPEYPCYFAAAADRAGELYYAFVEAGAQGTLVSILSRFGGLTRGADALGRKRNLVVFFQPEAETRDHDYYFSRMWGVLQEVHDNDPQPSSVALTRSPSDPLWDFPFMGTLMFVVGIAPSYNVRRSRNLGPGMIMIFQPRDVFTDARTGELLGATVRDIIRQRSRAWDGIDPHPDLGTYADPEKLEWKQYFLSDDMSTERRQCPFRPRKDTTPKA